MTNVDHVAKVAVGVVVVVALLFLLAVSDTLASERPFLVKQATTFIEVLRCRLLFQLDSYCDCWRRCRRVLIDNNFDFCDCRSSSHVVGEVLVIVIRIIVVEV
jgi:hypothetical protein